MIPIVAGTASEVDVSIAFVLYAGTSMVFSLVFGPLIPRFGISFFYFFGLTLVALTNIALGALDLFWMPNYRRYILAQCVVSSLDLSFRNEELLSVIMLFSRYLQSVPVC